MPTTTIKPEIRDYIDSEKCKCIVNRELYEKSKKRKIILSKAFPEQIVVSTAPYATVQQAINDEDHIDWHHEPEKATAITAAYAAIELKVHLKMVGLDLPIITSKIANPNIKSFILETHLSSSIFLADIRSLQANPGTDVLAIIPANKSIVLFGNSRINLLYAVYRMLEKIGFAWYDPYDTHFPSQDELARSLDDKPIIESPRVKLRGYWIWTKSGYIPDEYALWLARNRLNLAGSVKPSLRHKLGIKIWGGGHDLITQVFSDPALFKAHPDWFALIQRPHWYSFIRKKRQITDSIINPSFASRDAAEYFAKVLITQLSIGGLVDIDVLNLWPTDSRSSYVWDRSSEAIAIGNHTDNLLAFYLIVAEKLDEAFHKGVLNRPVTLAGISYYITWEPPTNLKIIERLKKLNYVHLFYTNQRSWSVSINQGLERRDANRKIVDALTKWKSIFTNTGIVEYHNYSVFSGVGVDDFEFAEDNYKYFTSTNTSIFAYMHPLFRNPGPRRLTNTLFARLAWESRLSKQEFKSKSQEIQGKYFVNRYGENAIDWCKTYAKMSRSTQNVKELLGENSLDWLLLQSIYWASSKYTHKIVTEVIPRYLNGGTQSLPVFGEGETREEISSFIGLDESLYLQELASNKYRKIIQRETDKKIKERMQSDVDWFDSTRSRYQLLRLISEYYLDRNTPQDETSSNRHLLSAKNEIDFLLNSPVTADTLSPVDQRTVIRNYLNFINSELRDK